MTLSGPEKPKRFKNTELRGILFVFVIIGLFLLGVVGYVISDLQSQAFAESGRWTTANVLSVKTIKKSAFKRVAYTYEVEGHSYQGSASVDFLYAAQVEKTGRIQVMYDPEIPSVSGIPSNHHVNAGSPPLIILAVGVVLILCGVLVVLIVRSPKKASINDQTTL